MAPNTKKSSSVPKSGISTASDIPLSQPVRSTPQHKTLYDLAAERQAELQGGKPFPKGSKSAENSNEAAFLSINPDGTLSSATVKEDPVGQFGQALFYSITFTMLHFTLDVLVHQQYRQTIDWSMIAKRTCTAFPALLLVIYLIHPRSGTLWMQSLLMGMSIATGCYISYASNEEAYFAVMKRAPPVGTLWIWSVFEMRLSFGLASLAAVAAFFWTRGYSIFN